MNKRAGRYEQAIYCRNKDCDSFFGQSISQFMSFCPKCGVRGHYGMYVDIKLRRKVYDYEPSIFERVGSLFTKTTQWHWEYKDA